MQSTIVANLSTVIELYPLFRFSLEPFVSSFNLIRFFNDDRHCYPSVYLESVTREHTLLLTPFVKPEIYDHSQNAELFGFQLATSDSWMETRAITPFARYVAVDGKQASSIVLYVKRPLTTHAVELTGRGWKLVQMQGFNRVYP